MNMPPYRSEEFSCQIQEVQAAIRVVLGKYSEYQDIQELTDKGFHVSVKTNPLMLKTPMNISLIVHGDGVIVTAETPFKAMIFDDIFGLYRRHIGRFFRRLRSAIRATVATYEEI